jgi:hypothetical protein
MSDEVKPAISIFKSAVPNDIWWKKESLKEDNLDLPNASNFKVIPSNCPELGAFIKKASWDSVSHTIKLWISETPELLASHWIEDVNHRCQERLKSPFCSLEPESLTITIKDGHGSKIANLFLSEIKLASHSCNFGSKVGTLTHVVLVEYAKQHLSTRNET